jgi:hypothetical protein
MKTPAQRRPRAIDRSLAGDPVEDICRALACAQSWRYQWRDRDLATDPSWSAALRSSPSTTPTNTPPRLEQVVVAQRSMLAQPGQGGGAASIKQALAPPGITPVPSPRTIDRILPRDAQGVTDTDHPHPSVHQRGTVLPVWICPHRPGTMAA